MDSSSPINNYEERLYSVFKTFDVDNEEALNKTAVLALCDALQLEQRGAALVDTLFEKRDQRVTFAQFRSGLLAVLGERPAPSAAAHEPAPAATPAAASPAASDDDSSGKEVAPKFVFGSKKYGRRSRPPRASPSPARAAPAALDLDHTARLDLPHALDLCRRLRMEGIDRRLVESIFESAPGGETSVGEFFDRLNAALGGDAAGADVVDELPADVVADAWHRAGVQRPRRLLHDLGFDGAAAAATDLERALDEEARALAERPAARGLLLSAALALARLRHERAQHAARAAAAERDRLRADLDEAERRARLLAADVDEGHARLEAERADELRRAEARHADAMRRIEAERLAERERAAAERAALDAELARRAEAERRLRAERDTLAERATDAEARAAAAEERAAAAERDRVRAGDELAAAAAGANVVRESARATAAELATRLEELRADNCALRDRCDELCAQLEARPPPAHSAPAPPSWREEAALLADPGSCESPPVSLEVPAEAVGVPGEGPTGAAEADTLRARLADAEARHQDEKRKLEDLIQELETSLEQMRVEYERCEEYWSGKLAEERALAAAEAAASDERLAELLARVADVERQFAPRLPAIAEAPALERAAQDLDEERRQLQAQRDQLQRQQRDLHRSHRRARRRDKARAGSEGGGGGGGGGGGAPGEEVRLRLARAEGAVARLAARLAAADLLVKDLYVENCLLGPAHRHL